MISFCYSFCSSIESLPFRFTVANVENINILYFAIQHTKIELKTTLSGEASTLVHYMN